MRRLMLLFAFALALPVSHAASDPAAELIETPMLQEAVAEGKLPPIAERIPAEPLVVDLAARGRAPGRHGGTLVTMISRAKDVRYMAVWGYARLVGYNARLRAGAPDLLAGIEVEEGRRFTLHGSGEGHRWSDGHPFTSEDFRYWWEDVVKERGAFSPGGVPAGTPGRGRASADGQHCRRCHDTVVFEWAGAQSAIPARAGTAPGHSISTAPAHYLMRDFHAKYADAEEIAAMVAVVNAGARSWAQYHRKNRLDNLYNFDNPELPVLQPWVQHLAQERAAAMCWCGTRSITGWMSEGRQLPYIDTVELEIAAGGLIAAKAVMGEATFQARSLTFADAPVLKRSEEEGGYTTRLWRSGYSSEIALYPNLTHTDPVWRALLRDRRFRRALSLAIPRKAINNALFFGFAAERGVSALEESPFFDEANALAWTRFDIDEANRLLDEIGLTQRNGAGIRLMADGRPLEIVVETAGERTVEDDALQLIAITWTKIGVRLIIKPLNREIRRNRASSGRTVMFAWFGWNNGIPTAAAPPKELAPVSADDTPWPAWGMHYETGGANGEAPDYEPAIRLLALYEEWSRTADEARRAEIWREMLAIHAEEVLVIGTVARAPMPVVIANGLGNVPEGVLYAWDPGAHLGVHRMDEFFFTESEPAE